MTLDPDIRRINDWLLVRLAEVAKKAREDNRHHEVDMANDFMAYAADWCRILQHQRNSRVDRVTCAIL